MAILDTFISFIQVSMPSSNVIILTDPSSKFSIKPRDCYAIANRWRLFSRKFDASKNQVLHFFEAYRLKYMKASRMLGDQLALAWVVKSHLPSAFGKFSKHDPFTGEVNGASVLFLPCAVYNWTPPEGAGQFRGMPLDVKV
ncbi:hypothetical protein PR202_gb27746 [Eleusine coracana subsp. coracana]|uniref:Uncharacterized protein n=1 Tax=Eleusine coracana subsp. coracana TaxID=191504 RepID=A0AAV5FUN1_ELECO|nr:hypothetical protein PR202_gb27746 [Eleusine coracana subsp. coracana]